MRLIGNVEKDAQVRAVASGALPSGDAVVVNADGTVSVVEGSDASAGSEVVFNSDSTTVISSVYDSNAERVVVAYRDIGNSDYGTAVVGTVSGTSISFGSPVVFESARSEPISITYDANAQKVVVSYRDDGNSDRATAIVGTVSGTSISFGTPVVFDSTAQTGFNFMSSVYDVNAQKVVIAYDDAANSRGRAIVGTISGTSISFGSSAEFESAAVGYLSSAYDSNAQKVVVTYRDEGNSNHGTAVVGTVSGTSISFGTPVVFEAAAVDYTSVAYDANAQKVVIAYRDEGNSRYGTAVVGTVSGTSISFGSPAVFNSATSDYISATYDANAQKVVIAYKDEGNSNYGTTITGTVSGTSISFDSPVVFNSGNSVYNSATYEEAAQKVVMSYRDEGNSDRGTSVVFSQSSTNLTSENFLGFAAHTYADTQSALVNSTCTVDRNQSGLTAGQTYYVQTDGSLGTTAADPSVVAGTAISSTEIIVKG
jgi:hypothetical protein